MKVEDQGQVPPSLFESPGIVSVQRPSVSMEIIKYAPLNLQPPLVFFVARPPQKKNDHGKI